MVPRCNPDPFKAKKALSQNGYGSGKRFRSSTYSDVKHLKLTVCAREIKSMLVMKRSISSFLEERNTGDKFDTIKVENLTSS